MVDEVELVEDIDEIVEVFFSCWAVGEIAGHKGVEDFFLGFSFLERAEYLPTRVIGAVGVTAGSVKDESAFTDGYIFLDLHRISN